MKQNVYEAVSEHGEEKGIMSMFRKKEKEELYLREDGLTDYDVYIMGKTEKWINILLAAAALFVVGYIFYHSMILSSLLMLLSLKWPSIRTKQIIAKRKSQLNLQFKDMLYSLSSSLSVGKSVESGIQDALNDLRVIYPDPETDILVELEYILRGLNMNHTVEKLFGQFAERAHLEDIENFVDIFVTCKRTGGDLIEVMRAASNTIGEKIEIRHDIETTISGKKYEFRFMMVMPVVMVLFLTLTSKEYMEPVFTHLAGRAAMTVAIIIFGISYAVGSKIMEIKV